MNNILPSSAIATSIADRNVSYSQFCCGIERVATRLRSLELDRGVAVALIMDRGPELYASQFGVLSMGGFFLPIDPANPLQRIKFLLNDSQAKCALVDAASAEKIRSLGLDLHVIELGPESIFAGAADATDAIAARDAKPIVFPHAADDPAYMIYTSGSTGQPKGVCIHWEAICNHNEGMIDVYEITSSDRIMQMISIGFDLSIEVIFTTIRSGACLVTVDPQALDSPVTFLRWVREQKLTLLNMPTALWHRIVPALEDEPLPDCVRLVTIGGEQIKTELVDLWFKHVSPDKVRLVHGYGPTETTITSTVCDLTPNNREAIGRPIKNMECHIVADDHRLIETSGETGELYISGVSVAKGYWNRPEQTAAAFMHSDLIGGRWCYRTGDRVMWDQHGQLLFCGRIDSQVKYRGFRIELHEIENAICLHPEVTNAIVLKSDARHEQLVCYAVPQKKDACATGRDDELQRRICSSVEETLPYYMVPSRFMFLDKFPMTVGGKVDTRKLLSLVEADQSDPPETPVSGLESIEAEVTRIWQSVLGSAPATSDTTFEQSGGDSLAGMAMAIGLAKSFPHKSFGVATLVSFPTVNQLAEHIRQATDGIQDEESGGLYPIISSLGQPLESGSPVLIFLPPGGGSGYLYNDLLNETIKSNYSILILDSPWLTGELPADEHKHSAASIASVYADALAKRIPRSSRIVTAGYSFGGILAFETARFLSERGFEVAKVINIDQPVPAAIEKANPVTRLANWTHRLKAPIMAWEALSYAKDRERTRAGEQTRFSDNQDVLRSLELEDIHGKIEDDYKPEPCDLELHLIRGDVMEAKYRIESDYGWTPYSPALSVHRVTGTHLTIFAGRNLRKLSAKFQQLV